MEKQIFPATDFTPSMYLNVVIITVSSLYFEGSASTVDFPCVVRLYLAAIIGFVVHMYSVNETVHWLNYSGLYSCIW